MMDLLSFSVNAHLIILGNLTLLRGLKLKQLALRWRSSLSFVIRNFLFSRYHGTGSVRYSSTPLRAAQVFQGGQSLRSLYHRHLLPHA